MQLITIPSSFFLILLASNLSYGQKNTEIELPITADLGIGFGELHSDTKLTASKQRIFLFKPEISGSVSSETLTKYKDNLPSNIPEWLTKADVAYSPYVLPTLYYTKDNNTGESVHGMSIGPGLDVSLGSDYLTIGGGIGIMATYLHIESERFKENHYVTLGANARWNIKLKPIKYIHLEVGQQYSQSIERKLSNDEYIGRFHEDYVMLHFRFPFTTNVRL